MYLEFFNVLQLVITIIGLMIASHNMFSSSPLNSVFFNVLQWSPMAASSLHDGISDYILAAWHRGNVMFSSSPMYSVFFNVLRWSPCIGSMLSALYITLICSPVLQCTLCSSMYSSDHYWQHALLPGWLYLVTLSSLVLQCTLCSSMHSSDHHCGSMLSAL